MLNVKIIKSKIMEKNLSNYVLPLGCKGKLCLPLGLPLCFTPKDGGEFLSQDNKSGRYIRNDRCIWLHKISRMTNYTISEVNSVMIKCICMLWWCGVYVFNAHWKIAEKVFKFSKNTNKQVGKWARYVNRLFIRQQIKRLEGIWKDVAIHQQLGKCKLGYVIIKN